MAAYTPMVKSLGILPEFPNQQIIYDLHEVEGFPASAKEVFLYAFVTTHQEGDFQRGYYEMYTSSKDLASPVQYAQYMNVVTGQGLLAENSSNMWFPVGDGKFTITLIHPGDRNKSIAWKSGSGSGDNWSEVFVIGYRE